MLVAQTNPTPQNIPYSQNFSSFNGSATAYPAGWQGWTITGSTSTSFPTAAPSGDQTLASGTAAANSAVSAFVGDAVGKIAFLNTSTQQKSIAFALNTTGANGVTISYTVATQRQQTTARIGAVGLQYRVGTAGDFTDVAGSEYQNPGGSDNITGTGSLAPAAKTITLPAAVNNQPVVQLRWVYREISGSGNRPGFSVTDVSVTVGGTPAPSITAGTVPDFGSVTVGTTSASQSFNISGSNLTGAPGVITITSPSTDFQVSANNTNWGVSADIPYTSATLASTPVYVRFAPQTAGSISGNLSITGGGLSNPVLVAVSGTGAAIPAPAVPVATAATSVSANSFVANWNAVSGATGYRLDVYTLASGSVTDTIAGWNMSINTVASQTADEGNANNVGIQTLTSVGTNTITYPAGPSGTSGTPNPYSVNANGWNGGTDTKYWQVDLNTTGVTNVTVSSKQAASSTGPSDFKLQYRVGASGTWTDVTGGTVDITTALSGITPWFDLTDLPLPAAADNQPLVSLRWIMTSDVAVNSGAVSSTGTSRISAIYIKGQTAGQVKTFVSGYQNLAVGNVTSYTVTGLTANTNYYYVVRSENNGGSSANSNEIAVTTTNIVTPLLTATAISGSFGQVCINTSASPESFTINGANLTTANVEVGPLAGYSFSTTANGTYAATLSIPQTGGSFSQQVFVRFDPTVVQSYNGNIPVSGGGAPATSVVVTGEGINSTATVATGSASAITSSSATLDGSISVQGCSAVTAYGFEYSTTNNFANGTGTQVVASNLSGGNFSASLTGLTPSTTYYYKAFATNGGGTVYGSQQSFTTASLNPTLTVTNPASFGLVCLNTTSATDSFTISGSNLTAADISVGALSGYTFSTSLNGTFFNTLTISQPGGNNSFKVYVRFSPTVVQSYNGNVIVSGGGAVSAAQVTVTGSGVNTTATVNSGSATGVTTTAATVSGNIVTEGCSPVTSYGIEYSTTSNFANGTGTQVSSNNINGGGFSSGLSGLSPSTTYYFKAYATNSGGTVYGLQQSFTTAAPPPAVLSATSLTAFGNVCVNATAGPNSFTLTGSNLIAGNINIAALTGYSFSTTLGGTYTNTLTISQTGGNFSQQVFVRFMPTATQSYNGNIAITGGGALQSLNVAVTGSGVSTPPTVNTGVATNITAASARLSGSVTDAGCSNVTETGFEFSTINNFANGTGSKLVAVAGGNNFSINVSSLAPGVTYYFKAYAANNGGIAYGQQQSFTTAALPNGFTVFPTLAKRGQKINFSLTNVSRGYHAFILYNATGARVFKYNMNIQGDFINQQIMLPAALPAGIYHVEIRNDFKSLSNTTIFIN